MAGTRAPGPTSTLEKIASRAQRMQGSACQLGHLRREFIEMPRGAELGTAIAEDLGAMPRPARRRSEAFTIIELMIVLAIMSVMVMTVAPSLASVLADHRQSSAAYEIVRFARRARAQAVSTGYAQMLRIHNAEDAEGRNGLGTIRLYAGMNNKCTKTPWAATFSPTVANFGPSELFDMTAYNTGDDPATMSIQDDGRPVIWFEVRIGTADGTAHTGGAQICYQPNGEIYRSHSSAAMTNASNLVVQNQAILLTVRRKVTDVEHGTARQVLFPPNGNARLR